MLSSPESGERTSGDCQGCDTWGGGSNEAMPVEAAGGIGHFLWSGGLRLFWTRNVTLVLIGEHVRERAAAAADVEHLLDAVEGHALDEALGGRHRSVVLRSRKTHGEMWERSGGATYGRNGVWVGENKKNDLWEKWGVGGRKKKRRVGEMGCGWAKQKTTHGRNGVCVGEK